MQIRTQLKQDLLSTESPLAMELQKYIQALSIRQAPLVSLDGRGFHCLNDLFLAIALSQ